MRRLVDCIGDIPNRSGAEGGGGETADKFALNGSEARRPPGENEKRSPALLRVIRDLKSRRWIREGLETRSNRCRTDRRKEGARARLRRIKSAFRFVFRSFNQRLFLTFVNPRRLSTVFRRRAASILLAAWFACAKAVIHFRPFIFRYLYICISAIKLL